MARMITNSNRPGIVQQLVLLAIAKKTRSSVAPPTEIPWIQRGDAKRANYGDRDAAVFLHRRDGKCESAERRRLRCVKRFPALKAPGEVVVDLGEFRGGFGDPVTSRLVKPRGRHFRVQLLLAFLQRCDAFWKFIQFSLCLETQFSGFHTDGR